MWQLLAFTLVIAFNCQLTYNIYVHRRHYLGFHVIFEFPGNVAIITARLLLSALMVRSDQMFDTLGVFILPNMAGAFQNPLS